jgi:putative addiction module component (TIGR02574 family)
LKEQLGRTDLGTARDRILQDALRLSVPERATLAAEIIDSLDEETDDDEAAWEEEIARRISDYESGKTSPIPWEKARQIILGAGK